MKEEIKEQLYVLPMFIMVIFLVEADFFAALTKEDFIPPIGYLYLAIITMLLIVFYAYLFTHPEKIKTD